MSELSVYGRPLAWKRDWQSGDRFIEGAGRVDLYDHLAVTAKDGTRLATYIVIETRRTVDGDRFTAERLMNWIENECITETGDTLYDAIEEVAPHPPVFQARHHFVIPWGTDPKVAVCQNDWFHSQRPRR